MSMLPAIANAFLGVLAISLEVDILTSTLC